MGLERRGRRRRATSSPRVRGRSERHAPALRAPRHGRAVTGPIEPVIVDGGWENAHDAILGADNKAAVAVFLEVARRAAVEGAPARPRAAVHGRGGGRARRREGVRRVRPAQHDFGYVFDHATPIGEVVVALADLLPHRAEFHGRAAHAGIRPEDGRSAILAAAHAIAAMPHGRIDEQTTANVGSVHGGVGSTNVVPERCRLLAEARSLDPDRVEAVVAADRSTPCTTAPPHGGVRRRRRHARSSSPATARRPRAPAVVAAEAALRACGYAPSGSSPAAASDANALEAAGHPVREPRQRHRAQPRADRARQRRRARGHARRRASRCSTRSRHISSHELPLRAPGGAHRLRGRDRRRASRARSGTRTARRSTREWVAHPGSVGDRRPRRRAPVARAPAARGDRRPRPARAPRRQARRGGARPARVRAARAGRGDRQGRRALGAPDDLQRPRPASPTSSATSSSPPACATSRATRSRTSASRSRRARSRTSTPLLAEVPDAKTLIGLLLLRQRLA